MTLPRLQALDQLRLNQQLITPTLDQLQAALNIYHYPFLNPQMAQVAHSINAQPFSALAFQH
jgi:hypothetical protein